MKSNVKTIINARIDLEVKHALNELAEKENRSISYMVNKLLKTQIKKYA